MRKCSESKSVAGKSGNKRGPRAKKDTAFADKRMKTGCKRNIIKNDTAVLPNSGEDLLRIAPESKKVREEKSRALDRKEPLDIQKLLAPCPEEPGKAVAKKQNEAALLWPGESLEKTAAKIEQQVREYVETITGLEIELLKEKTGRIAAEEKARMYAQQLAQLQENFKSGPESQEKTGVCNCCGRTDISEEKLVKIDSGQRMCPACLAELMSLLPNDI